MQRLHVASEVLSGISGTLMVAALVMLGTAVLLVLFAVRTKRAAERRRELQEQATAPLTPASRAGA